MKPRIAFFGSSLVSAYWNGAATYYRGMIRALHARGFDVTFYEPDAYDRQKNRDIDDPAWAKVVVYSGTDEGEALRMVERARHADIIVKASGVGVFDALLEKAIASRRDASTQVVFWDVDAAATLARLAEHADDPFRQLVPDYDWVLTYGGGQPVVDHYVAFGARRCVPIYNALDPETHHPVRPEARFAADLALLANRLPDRERRIEEFFLRPAASLADHRFLLGGNGWHDKAMSSNVRTVGHVYTADHNAFNCSAKAVLNVARDSMAAVGFSPATRVFEAAGAAACVLTDAWEGIELFLEPGEEILVAQDGAAVAEQLRALTPERARQIGERARFRVLAQHTYAHRAEQLDALLSGASSERGEPFASRTTTLPRVAEAARS